MIYSQGVGSLQQQWRDLLHTQMEVSTGRRVLTPADDPIAAARAHELNQSKAVNAQFKTNLGYAKERMNLVESQLTGVTDILQYMRERAGYAGNGGHKEEDLRYIATDLRGQFEGLMGLANSQDGMGDYLFSGYKANDKPFNGDLFRTRYAGDHGSQTMQVSASRYLPVSLPGSDIFMSSRQLNDDLIGAYTGTRVDGAENEGDAALSGTFDYSVANFGDKLARRYEITYNDDGVNPPTWDIYEYRPDVADKVPVAIGVASLNDPAVVAATGVNLSVGSGAPADGDRFEMFVSSPNMFDNIGMFIGALERPGPSGMANGAVAAALENLDGALENILKVRAQVGSQLTEVQNLESVNSDVNLQYEQVLSNLLDTDYVEALSRFTQQMTYLQASQQSFMKISGLSLFNYL